jgi:serine/threonine-protein kinase HipA
MSAENKTILVYADWEEIGYPVLMGKLVSTHIRGKEVFSFEYSAEWLASEHVAVIDPGLQLYSGTQYVSEDKPNFGIFLDSSPDRWGRVLMKRRAAILARQQKEKVPTLYESDFLLGVYDLHRMGGLRFKLNQDGEFLNNEHSMAAPPFTSIRELEEASLRLEKSEDIDDKEALKWINLLIAPGASLGGARPKASVRDPKGQLYIAKFPSTNDERDTGAWEKVAMEIAARCSIQVTPCEARRFSSKQHTFLSRRFDRTASGNRIHFASAMTLLGYNDGADFHDGASYLEIAEFIMRNGSNVQEDLEELWRRIVFSICIKNTDDHLRNHGFLLSQQGWHLSPLYDANPVPGGTGLTLNISDTDNSLSVDLARSVASMFRISLKDADRMMKEILNAVSNWQQIAESTAISRREIEVMEQAFTTEP